MKEKLIKSKNTASKDFIGNLLQKIPIQINITSVDMWVTRIVVWYMFVRLIISLF